MQDERMRFAVAVVFVVCSAAAAFGTGSPPPAAGGAADTIAVDSSVTFQTMRGWEAGAYSGSPATFNPAAAGLFDRAAELGINRLRLPVKSGAENPTDHYAAWRAAGYPESGPGFQAFANNRYVTVNDNGDPNSINSAGFRFTEVEDLVDRVVTPLRSRLAARGERLYINLNYVAFVETQTPYIHNSPAEYAEFMLALFTRLSQKYGWTPDAIEVILEPDNVPQWRSGTLIGQTIVATAQRLAASGFTPDFIGPSTTCMGNTVPYLDQMLAVSGVTNHLKEVSYHRYCTVNVTNLQAIASRVQQRGLASSMLEWWTQSNTYHTLHEDLKVGLNSAWQLGTLAGPLPVATFMITGSGVNLGPTARYVQHYFRHVRLGARRIGATSTQSSFDPLAFVNPNGSRVVVVKASAAGSFSIGGLSAGTYSIRFTTASQTNASHPDQTLGTGQSLATSIPGAGVLEVFLKGAASGDGSFVRFGRSRPPTSPPTGIARPRASAAGAARDAAQLPVQPSRAARSETIVSLPRAIARAISALVAPTSPHPLNGLEWSTLELSDTDEDGIIDTIVIDIPAIGVWVLKADRDSG